MPTFVLLTRFNPAAVSSPGTLQELERRVTAHIRRKCPGVEWLNNYAVSGPYDYLDIFEAPDVETAAKVSLIVRLHGHAATEVWSAVEWERFKTLLDEEPIALAELEAVTVGSQ
jgi:uncharacterized protein with GYD domain